MQWKHSPGLVAYEEAEQFMTNQVEQIISDDGDECIWLLEHPPLYTAGSSAKSDDLLKPDQFPVYYTGRGGQFTYHGPGQRIIYAMLNLKERAQPNQPDLRGYIYDLEEWMIQTLAHFDVKGERRENRVGIWVVHPNGSESKIAAIGVRIRKWVTFHGMALNVFPNMTHFHGIVPCGIREHGVTSLEQLRGITSMEEVDTVLQDTFTKIFGS